MFPMNKYKPTFALFWVSSTKKKWNYLNNYYRQTKYLVHVACHKQAEVDRTPHLIQLYDVAHIAE